MAIKNLLHHLNLHSTHLFPKFTPTSKVIISFFLVISLSFFIKSTIASSITIDTTKAIEKVKEKQDARTKGYNQESWIDESLMSNADSLKTAIAGDLEITSAGETSTVTWVPGGLIGLTNQSIAYLYQQPASGVQYIANSVSSFLGKPIYAANGFGFDRLKGISDIWRTTRNTVYTLISLFFVITGIMIMLKIKISPQATISIQSAIPKIISTLILVTFSFAIAGLMIDLSYVVMGVVLSIFNSNTDTKNLMSVDFFGFYNYLMTNVISTGTMTLITGITGTIGAGILIFAVANPIMGALTLILGWLLILIIILVQVIKFFIGLAKCYINLIIRIILGPLEIGAGIIPGSKLNFSSWFMNITANIFVFPISIIFLSLISAIIKAVQLNQLWGPPFLGYGNFIAFILGIASLLILSKLPELIPQMVFNIKPSPISKAFSESTGSTKKIVSSSTKAGIDYADQRWGGNESWYAAPIQIANRILGGKSSRTRIEKNSRSEEPRKL